MTLEIDSYLYYFFFTVVHCFFYRGLVGFWGCFISLRRIEKTLIFPLSIVWKEMFEKWVYTSSFFCSSVLYVSAL